MTDSNFAYVDWKHWDDAGFGHFDALEAAYFAVETGIRRGDAMRVLEVGFGNGSFIGWVQSLGGDIYGIETNPALVARARRILGEDRAFGDLEGASLHTLRSSFTHIVAFDVIEHMDADVLTEALHRFCELLTPEGKLILRFPNGDSPFGRVSQHGDPTHILTIGRQKLEYFARAAGLVVVDLRAPALPAGGVGFARGLRRCAIGLGRGLLERLIAILYFGGRRIPLDPNYLAILSRPR